MITGAQMKAARALLGIDQKELARLSGVSLPTIQRMEASDGANVRGVIDTLTKVVEALDRAGIPWVMAVESDSTRSIEASVSADLAVHALVAGAEPRYVERIPHGGALPDLARTKINLYVADPSHGPAVEALAAMIRDAVRAPRLPSAHRDHDLAGGAARA